MMASRKDPRKKNYTEAETAVLLREVEMRANTLFGSLSGSILPKSKYVAWQGVTQAVNEVGGNQRTLPEVKKKWADLKLHSKKRLARHMGMLRETGGGGATSTLSPEDEKICAIIGEEAVQGVYVEGDTDLLSAGGSEGM